MIRYTRVKIDADLEGILELQRRNLPSSLSQQEMHSQGFVTVVHSFEEVKKLNDIEPHVIAKDDENVIAYLLAMTTQSQEEILVLKPIFETFQEISFANKKVSDFQYIVVGQVCVDKVYRSKGILDACYQYYKNVFADKYDFAITEIDASNLRSLNAHKRIGFKELYRYTAANDVEWVIVLWDWNHLTT